MLVNTLLMAVYYSCFISSFEENLLFKIMPGVVEVCNRMDDDCVVFFTLNGLKIFRKVKFSPQDLSMREQTQYFQGLEILVVFHS